MMKHYRLYTKKDGKPKSNILCSTKKYAEKLARGALGMGFEAYVVEEPESENPPHDTNKKFNKNKDFRIERGIEK